MTVMCKLAALIALVVVAVACPLSGQVPLTDVGLLEGPWECTSPTGIDGIFISVHTALVSAADAAPAIDSQTIDIRVYHRGNGQSEDARYFSPPPYRSLDQVPEQDYRTDLKDRHLAIHYNLDLELTFVAGSKHWTGTWWEHGKRREVTLERPHPVPGSTENLFVGDWGSLSEVSARPHYTGSLHIRESSDGVLTAWLDRKSSAIDRSRTTHLELRNGERLEIDADQSKLTLSTTNNFGAPFHYSGTLSGEGENLAGEWLTQRSGRLAAPDNFVRRH